MGDVSQDASLTLKPPPPFIVMEDMGSRNLDD
jgi:hypothetical protein